MPNLYVLLQSASPQPSRFVGAVIAINGDKTSTVALPEGGTLTVRGDTVPVGHNAFIVGDAIDSEAPDLTLTAKIYV